MADMSTVTQKNAKSGEQTTEKLQQECRGMSRRDCRDRGRQEGESDAFLVSFSISFLLHERCRKMV